MNSYKTKKVKSIIAGSIADEIGLEPGDVIVSINNQDFCDIVDYKLLIADEYIELSVLKSDGQPYIFEVEKEYDEDLGIEFNEPTIDHVKRCKNRCIFCFVDQMPRGMRKSLYVKDDDYRMSFFHGNFITLTNLLKPDIDRIIKLHMSPLYVSVHTTNGPLRQRMMGNPTASEIMDQLRKLTAGGIKIHCQIVLCPGINDGRELDKSIEDLISLWPGVSSVAVVPVGLTKFRKKLYPLKKVDKHVARRVINQVRKWQTYCKKRLNYTFVFLADEFYIVGEEEFPPYSHYEDFPQTENGVGLIPLFMQSLKKAYNHLPQKMQNPKKVSIATGLLAHKFIKKAVSPLKQIQNLDVEVFPIKNTFFGQDVTVAGLVTAEDLISQLKHKNLGCELFIPEVMLKEGEKTFLDNLSIENVEKNLSVPVKAIKIDGAHLINCIVGND